MDDDVTGFALFTLAIMLSAWLGGFRPGLIATAAGALAGTYFFVEPVDSLETEKNALETGLFLVDGLGISWLAGGLRARPEEG